jgi:DNA polymerase
VQTIILTHQVDFGAWRAAARRLALGGIPPEQALWSVHEAQDLFATEQNNNAAPEGTFTAPRSFVHLAETAIQANDPERFALLYTLIWRIHGGERRILEDAADPTVQRVQRLAQSVRRDTHKMRAFLRFREVVEDEETRYVAWFEPDHYIVEANAAFFVRRFATMSWSILTPYRSAHWNGTELSLAEGADKSQVPDDDGLEKYWRAYFSSIFNPARLKITAMTSEMPKKYWRNLPEAAAIPNLIRDARSRTETMVETPVFSPPKPLRPATAPAAPGKQQGGLQAVANRAATCRLCPLWQQATQTVFGEGPAHATLMLVGEQPGDQEDLAGRPFVGPAGKLLDQALLQAGIDRRDIYVTNAVKHFKFEPRGKRRIHATPTSADIEICRVWLDEEIALVAPRTIVLLGASAARAVLRRAGTISRERGRALDLGGGRRGLVTVHPSYLLRLPDEATRQREFSALVEDLRFAATHEA